jgi:hypothetical protein
MRPNQPSCVQEVEDAVDVGVDVFILVLDGGSSPSKQSPNQPGYLQEDVEVGEDEVVVKVGAGARDVVCEVFVVVVSSSSSSLQPNQPGVLHVDVDDVEVVFDEVLVLVVVSSRQPHQPGVLHVSVLVRVLDLDLDLDVVEVEVAVGFAVVVVVVSVPLLSKYFQV